MPEILGGYQYAVFARDDLSGWSEGRAIMKNDSRIIAKFLYEEIYRNGCPL